MSLLLNENFLTIILTSDSKSIDERKHGVGMSPQANKYVWQTFSNLDLVSVASVLIPFYFPQFTGCFSVHTIIHSASYFTRANKLRHGQYGYGDGEYNMNSTFTLCLGRSVRYVTKCVAYHIKAALRCILQYEQTLLAIFGPSSSLTACPMGSPRWFNKLINININWLFSGYRTSGAASTFGSARSSIMPSSVCSPSRQMAPPSPAAGTASGARRGRRGSSGWAQGFDTGMAY